VAQSASKSAWLGEWPRGTCEGLAAQADGLARHLGGAGPVDQRHIAGRQQAPVDGAEVDHHAVVGAGGLDGRAGGLDGQGRIVLLLELEQAEAGGREHQLAGEAQQVHRQGPVLAVEGAQRLMVLAQQQVLDLAGAELGIALQGDGPLDPGLVAGRPVQPGRQGVAPGRIGVALDRAGQLHDMRIGVMDGLTFHVGHLGSSARVSLTPARMAPLRGNRTRPSRLAWREPFRPSRI